MMSRRQAVASIAALAGAAVGVAALEQTAAATPVTVALYPLPYGASGAFTTTLSIPGGATAVARSVQQYATNIGALFIESDPAGSPASRTFTTVVNNASFDPTGKTYIGTFRAYGPGVTFVHVYEG